jgi:hypothetical protein
MVVLLERGRRCKRYSLEWTRRIVTEKSSDMTQLCQNEQKQDACFHCSTVQIPLYIDVPDHLPASWLNNLTSHLGILTNSCSLHSEAVEKPSVERRQPWKRHTKALLPSVCRNLASCMSLIPRIWFTSRVYSTRSLENIEGSSAGSRIGRLTFLLKALTKDEFKKWLERRKSSCVIQIEIDHNSYFVAHSRLSLVWSSLNPIWG